MAYSAYQLAPEQSEHLLQLNSMIAYVNYAMGCCMTMEVEKCPHMLLEHVDGFMMLSAHLTEEVQRVLSDLPRIDGKAVARYVSS